LIVYASDKARFINDVINNNIEEVILTQFLEKLKRTTTKSEIESLSGLAAMVSIAHQTEPLSKVVLLFFKSL